MDTALIKTNIVTTDRLPVYEVKFHRPEQWESKIADLQEKYISKGNYGTSRTFNDTLTLIRTTAISKQLFTTDQKEILDAISFACLNLEPLFLLLYDPKITEIFSNKYDNDIVITHRQHGRCRTNLKFSRDMWHALKVRAEYDSGRPLNERNPALKIGLETPLGNLRISLQVPPLTTMGPTFSIRRLPAGIITLEQLVEQQQVPAEISTILSRALHNRENIVIAGEPGSGKTTLANALLAKSDPSWRLIILEDAREISLSPREFPMLIHYNMPAVGSSDRFQQRSNEIARMLHRSPDYVFLGEIQNKEDTKVAFEGFAAGIRGMATTHALNISGLLTRWKDSHNLPDELLSSIDWIVITTREIIGGNIRLGVSGLFKQEGGKLTEIH